MSKAVVLLSGGMDSATCAAFSLKEGFEVFALSLDYGQRHTVELERARAIARHLKLADHRILRLDLSIWGGSSLVNDGPIPRDRDTEEMAEGIPSTYVPARNTVFLSLALSYAEAVGASEIFIGANAIDYSGYPDCRPEFIRAFQRVSEVGTQAGIEGNPIRIQAPLLDKTKGEIITLATELGVDLSQTLSCYSPGEKGTPCGRCDACRLRAKGFEEAGVKDPALP